MFDFINNLDANLLSRLQFAYTIIIHFIFVPLTLGLSFLMAIMETLYVKTGNKIYKDMVKFWGLLFGINFAMGVSTGIPMEFQFGTNWAYYSHYVGDIFGAPLAIEGLMAFFLEATFVGLFFFGWNKLSKAKHCLVTWLVFLGSNFSALWILIANGWMQNPVGSYFNTDTMRMELLNFTDLLFNPAAQTRFFHTLTASYTLAAIFVIGVSSFYLLKFKYTDFAKRSIKIAAIVGVFSSVLSAVGGDLQGVLLKDMQPTKLAALELIWEQEEAPASFTVFAIPKDYTGHKLGNLYEIKIPKVLGWIMTHNSVDTLLGIKELRVINEKRIQNGLLAYKALEAIKKGDKKKETKNIFNNNVKDLGYALLLKNVRSDIVNATNVEIKEAAINTIPKVYPLFLSFRLMVGLGFFFILFFTVMLILSSLDKLTKSRFMLVISILIIPTPWIAIQAGWFVAEYGRQPWTINGILPTSISHSILNPSLVLSSLIGFVVLYSILLVIDIYLMIKYIKIGPSNKNNNDLY
jgi:cytochrome d ubiquinol oxidase subunit I